MFYDYHVHTYYSDDSMYPMENVIIDAIELGVKEICITDHVDYGIKIDPEGKTEEELADTILNVNYSSYVKEIAQLKERFQNQICIKQGLEFGVQSHTIPEFEALYKRYPWDFIILSCHQVENKEFWNQNFQKGKTQKEYNERYYEELLAVVKRYKNYSVLGHLDLISRYDLQGNYPFELVRDKVEEILRVVIADGKGIEINTSSFRYGLKDLTPSRDILKLYRELGGEILTIGSDSHKPGQLVSHFEEVLKEVKEIGFETICTFENMKPIFHKI